MIEHVIAANINGWATCPTVNKKPVKEGWGAFEPSAFLDESEYRDEYLIVLRPTDLVIDVDPRNFPEGRNIWREFKNAHGLDGIDKDTYVVKTGGGGYHIYLSKPADVLTRKHFKEWPGLDFITGNKSMYVMGPGSKHESGNKYEIIKNTPADIKPAPPALLIAIEKGRQKDEKPEKQLAFSDDPQNIARYTEYLRERAPVAIEGEAGDQTTFKVACRGRDFRLSEKCTYELMLLHYNVRCVPPWAPDDLEVKVQNAYKYNEEVIGKKDPEMAFTEVHNAEAGENGLYDPPVAGKSDWKLDAGGNPKAILSNAIGYISAWPEINSHLRYSELSHDIEITGKLPWAERRTGKHWTDEDTIHMKYYLATRVKTEFSTNTVMEAVYIVAARKMYHPVKEYLEKLKWDGVKRLDRWLITYGNAENDEYTRTIGRKTLLAAVTRAFRPGCKFDHVLVIEGPQGIGKSRAVAALGGAWFSDFHIDPSNKDTVDAMRGKWIIEIPEMESLRGGKDMQLLKAFITKTEDRVRLAYARKTIDLPRRGIFIGTFNPDNIGYLTDSTGNRRFWPVLCPRIDVEGLKRDRDQLFAEAVLAYRDHEPIFITDDKIRREAEAQADDRVEVDPWVDVVSHWSLNAGKDVTHVTTADIFEMVLHGSVKNITRSDQVRIGKALSASYWYKHRGSNGYVYARQPKDRYPNPVSEEETELTIDKLPDTL